MTQQEVTENCVNIKKEITKISQREEALVLIGDCNRAIGNDRLGVKDNHLAISHGGSLIRELLEDKEYFLANSLELAEGGPWTWMSRADRTVKSCLDLVILSSNLKPYVSKVMIDSEQKLCAKKVGITKGKEKVTKSDHFPILVVLEKMPKANVKVDKASGWNLGKPGGWSIYKAV